MEVNTQTQSSMGPPLSSPNGDRMQDQQQQGGQNNEHQAPANGGPSHPVGAAAAAQQPKVVQTAFIHKLYKYVYPVTWRAFLCHSSLTSAQHARRPEHPASHLVVEHQ